MSAYKPILGQNFLIDRFVRSRIIKTSSIETNETVIEIGAGKGFLTSELIKKTNEYAMGFTIEPILNTKNTPQFELGRYSVHSTDTSFKLNSIIQNISNKN